MLFIVARINDEFPAADLDFLFFFVSILILPSLSLLEGSCSLSAESLMALQMAFEKSGFLSVRALIVSSGKLRKAFTSFLDFSLLGPSER